MVRFLPYDQSDEESMNIVLQHIDFAIQYGEDLEFKEPKVIFDHWLLVTMFASTHWPFHKPSNSSDCLSSSSKLGLSRGRLKLTSVLNKVYQFYSPCY